MAWVIHRSCRDSNCDAVQVPPLSQAGKYVGDPVSRCTTVFLPAASAQLITSLAPEMSNPTLLMPVPVHAPQAG